jgi:hypothetical protein
LAQFSKSITNYPIKTFLPIEIQGVQPYMFKKHMTSSDTGIPVLGMTSVAAKESKTYIFDPNYIAMQSACLNLISFTLS